MAVDRRIGTELGGYLIVEPIGSGGTSVVYRAEHVRLGRTAALKLLVPGFGEADFAQRFLRESQLAASLDHPNIVPVYDAGEEDGLLYIAMAYIDGSDLKTLLAQEGRLPLRRALRIAAQVGSALDTAHSRALVHRDVKPANILVGPDDRAYLSDFGVVKELTSGGATRTGSFVGTIEYSAPEQIEGRDVGPATDVYALACVLYECLAGEAPFHRDSEVAVLNAHLHDAPPRLGGDLPPALDTVIAKALSKSPLDRYQICGDFLAAARAAAAERRVHRRRLAVSLGLLALAALAGAAAALGLHALVTDDARPAASPPVTVTVPGKAPAAKHPSLARLELGKSHDARTLNDAAYWFYSSGQYEQVLPFARKAMRLAKPGSPTRAYATANLGLALLGLGRCDAALPVLRQARKIEPPASTFALDDPISQAKGCATGGASAPTRSPSSASQQGPSRGR
jgi:serine/threonine-protein kinase